MVGEILIRDADCETGCQHQHQTQSHGSEGFLGSGVHLQFSVILIFVSEK